MRTTLVIDDALFRRAKQTAASLGISLSEFVSRALRESLTSRPKRTAVPFKMITFGQGGALVDHTPADFHAALEREDADREAR